MSRWRLACWHVAGAVALMLGVLASYATLALLVEWP
jgi:hypothetical protein